MQVPRHVLAERPRCTPSLHALTAAAPPSPPSLLRAARLVRLAAPPALHAATPPL
jgi:hypothetical protein